MSSAAEPVGGRDDALRGRLTALWETPDTWSAWLSTVDHKKLGLRYIYTAFVFFALGGAEAALIRAQLARPELRLLTPEQYNQLMSMHGITMMFLFISPVLSGFSFYLTPLLIGARELAFPRLNAFSYYGFLLAGVFMYASFVIGQAPNAGWFNYTPLSEAAFNPGLNIDFYTIGLVFLGISTTAGACNSIVTILKLRAPGMSIDKMPLFLWSSLTISASIIFAMPPLTVALSFLELERNWHFVFFEPARGGSPMLWQHLFWVFGHPWVYVVFLPATGMLSMIVPTFCRRPMIGHELVALSTVITGLVGFGVWVHHMFATGMSQLSMSFFAAASMTVSVPSAVTIFAWLATMWYGRVVLATPMLFTLAFIAQFLIGGISGVMTAAVPFDWQVTDTYFVVAHLHYVLAGGSVFGLFAALYYWAPKMYGWMLDERIGKASFWLMTIGFNVAFFPMHISGLLGMPRRVYTYPASMGVGGANLVSTIGAYLFALGIVITGFNLVWSRTRGARASSNPWGASSLEWLAASPPAPYNFERSLTVSSRSPLWDGGYSKGPTYDDGRLTPTTSPVDASAAKPATLPNENMWSVAIAFTMLLAFGALLMRSYVWSAVGVVATLWSLTRWLSPVAEADLARWGMILFLINEGMLFASLVASYFFLAMANPSWPPIGVAKPALTLPSIMTVSLLSSSAMLVAGERGLRNGNRRRYRTCVVIAIVLGIIFVGLQAKEYIDKLRVIGPTQHAYASMFYTITGLHGTHVAFGMLFLAWAFRREAKGAAARSPAIKNASLYWHFVDGVWLVILTSLYLAPRMA